MRRKLDAEELSKVAQAYAGNEIFERRRVADDMGLGANLPDASVFSSVDIVTAYIAGACRYGVTE